MEKYLLIVVILLLSVIIGCSNYDMVKIDDQVWMAKNLDVTHYRNGDEIPQVADSTEWEILTTGAWCYYDNDPANGEIYGKLYNWYAVNDPRGLAPEGWRVPSDDDWKEIERYLGIAENKLDSLLRRGTNEASKLSGAYELWKEGNLRNDSEFGSSDFMAIPAGYRGYDGSFDGIRTRIWWWCSAWDTSAVIFSSHSLSRDLHYDHCRVGRMFAPKGCGYSVRCVKD